MPQCVRTTIRLNLCCCMPTSRSQWLYDLCRGIDFEAVKPRQLPKSIGCSKNFPGKTSLATKEQVQPLGFCFARVFKIQWCSFTRLIENSLFYFFILHKGSILASSTSPGAGGEADQGQRSGEKHLTCSYIHSPLFYILGANQVFPDICFYWFCCLVFSVLNKKK